MKKDALYNLLPEDTAEAFIEAIDQFGSKTYEWLAHLWEPEIGGFYYSNSGRDYEGFLPDIESTCQALYQVQTLGMMDHVGKSLRRGLPEAMQKKILEFARGLQDPDGLFYHPQWGKEISPSRRGRDFTWAKNIIKELGGEYKYPLVNEQISQNSDRIKTLPEYMQSREAMLAYLDSFDIMHHSYRMGNTVGSQMAEISAAGFRELCHQYYVDHQNPKNGLWQEDVCYHSVNGLMKISGMFTSASLGVFPNYDKAIDSAIEVMLSDEIPKAVVDFFNPWRASGMILQSIRNAGMPDEAEKQLAKIKAISAKLISKTTAKMKDFVKPDGSVSYFRHYTSSDSQCMPVALYREPEGDVNATGLAIGGAIKRPLETLGVDFVPLYDKEDFERFLAIIESQKPPVKKPRPPKEVLEARKNL